MSNSAAANGVRLRGMLGSRAVFGALSTWLSEPNQRVESLVFRMPYRNEFRQLVTIAVPVVIVQVGMMFMGVVDTLMVGHLSANALASAALGNLYFYNVIVIAMGTVMALDPVVSQAVGAKDDAAVTRGVQRGVIL